MIHQLHRRRPWLLALLGGVLTALIAHTIQAQAPTAPLTVVVQTETGLPVRDLALALVAADGMTFPATTDAHGRATWVVAAQGWTLALPAPSEAAHWDPFYMARGGLPVFVQPEGTTITLLLAADGTLSAVAHGAGGETGSQAAVPHLPPPAPILPLATPTAPPPTATRTPTPTATPSPTATPPRATSTDVPTVTPPLPSPTVPLITAPPATPPGAGRPWWLLGGIGLLGFGLWRAWCRRRHGGGPP